MEKIVTHFGIRLYLSDEMLSMLTDEELRNYLEEVHHIPQRAEVVRRQPAIAGEGLWPIFPAAEDRADGELIDWRWTA